MQRLEVSGAVRPLYGSLCVKGLIMHQVGQLFLLRASYIYYSALCSIWVYQQLVANQMPVTSRPGRSDKDSYGTYIIESCFTFSPHF
jgi:hypothetical protein